MTTAHRPTFDPARGKDALRGPAYHQRLLPAHTQLKFRQTGQGGEADEEGAVDLRAELLAAEEAHYAKLHGIRRISSNKVNPSLGNGAPSPDDEDDADEATVSGRNKRRIEAGDGDEESAAAKRRRILEESRDVDADDSDGGGGGSDDGDDGDGGGSDKDDEDDDDDDDDSDEDSDDDDAILQRELEKIKRERAEKHAKEEAAKAAAEEAARERDIALGNPLLNKPTDFNIKRRWDDDVVFKNQARGTEEKGKKKEFINDLLRSDFHKRFMSKYVQ